MSKRKPREWWHDIVALISSFAFLALIGTAVTAKFYQKPAVHLAISTVLVSNDSGHGSGVHIGSGYILTAAHVVEDHDKMTVTDNSGFAQSGTVLWANKQYDVALIQIDNYVGLASSKLNCDSLYRVGDAIRAVGNPRDLKFVSTWGRIAAPIDAREPWKLAFLADISIGVGMSGGPVFDELGRVIGITVGVAVAPFGSFVPVPYGISYIVPATSACLLLAEGRRE